MRFGQEKVRPELVRHGHKSTKIMTNKRQRNVQQSVAELLDHYKKFHR